MSKLISIIVPVYKVEKYISRCVDSILNQSYSDFELILINDGSPDKSGNICDYYADQDKRIKVIHKKNGGLSAARNDGIKLSSGNLITFIDSDDWINPFYLETLLTIKSNYAADLVIGNFQRVWENTPIEEKSGKIKEFTNLEALNEIFGEYGYNMIIACGKLDHKSLFRMIHFPEKKAHEDEFISYKILYNSKKIVLTTQVLYYYWQHNESIMGRGYNLQYTLDAVEALEERIVFFNQINQKQLANLTLKNLVFLYAKIKHNFKDIDTINRNNIKVMLYEFLKRFQSSNQPLRFKCFAYIHWYFPFISGLITDINSKIRD